MGDLISTPEMTARVLSRALAAPSRLKLFSGMMANAPIELPSTGGYRDVVLTANDWKIVQTGATPYAEGPVARFVFDGTVPFDVMGGYVVDDATGGILWMETFSNGPIKIRRNGDTLPVQPRYALTLLGGANNA